MALKSPKRVKSLRVIIVLLGKVNQMNQGFLVIYWYTVEIVQ